jgi:hypothetical protein
VLFICSVPYRWYRVVPLYVVPHATAPAGSCFSKLLKSKQLASPAAGLRMPCLLAACCAGASYHGDVAAVVAAGGQGCCTVFSRTMLAAQQLHVGLRLHTYDRTSHCSWRWTLPGNSYPCHSLCMFVNLPGSIGALLYSGLRWGHEVLPCMLTNSFMSPAVAAFDATCLAVQAQRPKTQHLGPHCSCEVPSCVWFRE